MREPELSCPYIDSAIDEIEKAREIHSKLREWANYWKDQYEELDRTSTNDLDAYKQEIKNLEDELYDLKRAIERKTT